ncbi:hypothetical protein GF377_10630, partial [candidate division GN15 bacterium]|nr:hypothetical protein [candidate division GN15 bacterium]
MSNKTKMTSMPFARMQTLTMVAVLIVAVSLFFIGCESDTSSSSTTDPDTTTMTVTVTPNSVGVNETAIVEANVSSGGSGVADQAVEFSVSPTGAGYFTPESDTTGPDGIAATVFTATTNGSAVISASIPGTSMNSSLGLSITEDTTGGGGTVNNGSVNVSVSDNLLLADGEDTSRITIVVRDALGQPAPDSTLVQLVAGEKFVDVDSNGFWSAGIDSLVFDANDNGQWDPMGVIPSNARTGGGAGTAHATFTAGEQSGTAYIKVTVNANGIKGAVDVPVQLSPNAELSYIYLASDSLSLSVKGTGGVEIGTIRATGYDINGNPVPEGMTIVFSILDGPAGGEQLDTLGYGPDTTVTNGSGVATTTLHSGTTSGTVRIRAFSDTIMSNATQVLIAAGPPAQIDVGATSCNVPYWDHVADTNGIVAIVSDVYNNPVNDSTVVYFTVDEGTIMSHQERTKEGKGIATSTWFAGADDAGADGDVWVYVETAGGTVIDSVMFINSHVPAVISVSGWQSAMLADGDASFYVWVSTVDLNNNYVVGGTPFKADAQWLTVTGGVWENGCYSSADRVKVQSTTLDVDRSLTGGDDDGIGAIDYVTYWHGAGAARTQVCTLQTGFAYSGTSTINADANMAPGETMYMSVTIKDRWGNPLGDHTLHMTVGADDLGRIDTDGYGEAFG